MEAIAKTRYSFEDYLRLPDEWVELLRGKLVKMSPMPSTRHQQVSLRLLLQIGKFLEGSPRQLFHPPFDVRIPYKGSTKDEDIITVLQPDLTVVCDGSKIDARGCLGAPDWVIEILSKGTARRDTHEKLAIYEESGVREYWIVHPEEETVIKYTPDQAGNFVGSKPFAKGEKIPVSIFPGFEIDLDDVFSLKP